MSAEAVELFNSPLEAGIRAVIILERLWPTAADLGEMVLFDHVVVHALDIGGPLSLHASVPERKGELLVRRGVVEAGLDMMRRCHLLDKVADEGGFAWRASEQASSYVELLESSYSEDMKTCAAWIARKVDELTKKGFREFVAERIGEWNENFSFARGAPGAGF